MIFCDFEFNNTTSEKVNLVCCSIYDTKYKTTHEWWLHNNEENKKDLKNFLLLNKDQFFYSHGVAAESRAFYSLGLNPYEFKWIDQFLEWRCLTNHNDRLNWGKQLVDGKVKFTKKPAPKWERVEGEKAEGFKHTHSLAEVTYKLLGEIRDTEHKTKMRDLIISNPPEFTLEERKAIQEYCTEDVIFLPKIFEKILNEYKYLLGDKYNKNKLVPEMVLRGKYSALTGIRECWGYPYNEKKTRNFASQVASILDDCQRDINRQFPDILPFKYNKKEKRFSWDQKKTREWIENNCDVEKWIKTDTGALGLSLEAWQKFFNYSHDYPEGNFGAQIVRYLKLKQSMNGFVPGGKKSFFDAVGSDERVRPYMNHYGSQSSRSQPGSTSYLLLKPAWQRVLLEPKPGYLMGSIDYGSQEYFVSALFYNDKNMIESYLSGDVYLAFAKLAGMVPEHGTKETHKYERDLCKATVLGISYNMSKYGLAHKLTQDTGRKWTEDEAQDLIDKFYEAYPDFAEGSRELQEIYSDQGYLKLPDGWYLWGDNDNFRSVGNFPIQGIAAMIMRRADMLAYERGLKIPCTLHDALYVEFREDQLEHMDILKDCMKQAFMEAFPGKEHFTQHIRLDPYIWGPSMEDNSSIVTPKGWEIDCNSLYIDDRAIKEYNRYKKYLEDMEEAYL